MKPVFADTFFFLALLNRSDAAHHKAVEISRTIRRKRITTTWVLTEVGDAMSLSENRRAFSEFYNLVNLVKQSPLITVIPATDELFERGVELFSRRLDKEWTITDCISFVVMDDSGLSDALTGDRHFEQAGFAALLR